MQHLTCLSCRLWMNAVQKLMFDYYIATKYICVTNKTDEVFHCDLYWVFK